MAADVLDELARRYIWWQSPTEALAHRDRFLCQLMQFATLEDLDSARQIFGNDAFRAALRSAPPGILDARSWNFWHLFYFASSPPPLPVRPLPP